MRRFIPAALIAFLLSAVAAPRAEAITAQDIIGLARAGLGEEVLLALIEVDGSIFSIDPATLTELKKAGISDRVIEAMVRSGRNPAPPPQPPLEMTEAPPRPPAPQVIVIEHERPVVEQVAVPVPVYVAVPQGKRVRSKAVGTVPFDPSPGFGAPTPPSSQVKPHRPVYWGWGGKLRPDAWKPAGHKDGGKGDKSGSRSKRE